MNNTRFSIIIPIYNTKESFLIETLVSVSNLIYDNYETILINDGSNSKTEKILNDFVSKNKNFQLYSNTNHGQTYSRKFGITKASGDYILFLDSDDILNEDCLLVLNKIINKYKSDVIIFNMQRFNNDINHLSYQTGGYFKEGPVSKNDVIKKLVGLKLNSICEKCAKKELLNTDINIESQIRYGEDLEQSSMLIKNAKSFYYTHNVLYYYRINEENRDYYDCINIKDINFSVSTYYLFFSNNEYCDLKPIFKKANIYSIIFTVFNIYKYKSGDEKISLLNNLNNEEIVSILKIIKEKTSFVAEVLFYLFTHRYYLLLSILAKLYNH